MITMCAICVQKLKKFLYYKRKYMCTLLETSVQASFYSLF